MNRSIRVECWADSYFFGRLLANKALIRKEKNKAEVFKSMLEVTKKLAKVADAVDEYEKTEKKELKRLIKEVPAHGNPSLILAEDSDLINYFNEQLNF